MKNCAKVTLAAISYLLLLGSPGVAESVTHMQSNAAAPFASTVRVPSGFETYYLSGIPGQSGNTSIQTADVLRQLKEQLAALGMTFGDVVQAHVFLAGDRKKNGKMDYDGMNAEWFKEFGTVVQPNKPARATVQVVGLARSEALVEIEMVAVKKSE